LPDRNVSRIALAKPGNDLVQQGDVPLPISDVSSPMRSAANPNEATVLLVGEGAVEQGPGGHFALVRVEDAGAAGDTGEGGSGPDSGGTSHSGGSTNSGGSSHSGGANDSGGSSHSCGANDSGGSSHSGGANDSGGSSPTGGVGDAGGESSEGGESNAGSGGLTPPGAHADSSGCNCRFGAPRPTGAAAWALLALARWRRRRRAIRF
jgi:hypothetical protein